MDTADGSDAGVAGSRHGEKGGPALLRRKSVLMGMAASMGVVFVNAAQPSAVAAGTVKQIATTQPAYALKWTPYTGYPLGQQVISPTNDVVSAKVAHTSSAAFATDAAKWNLSSTYSRMDSSAFNVLDHGMTIGANVSTSLQSLITSVSGAGGGVVFFPAGLFYAADVRLAANVTLLLDTNAVLKLPNASAASGILAIPTGANNATITGGTLDGNHSTYTGSTGYGISAQATTAVGLTVRGVNFVNMPESGIRLDNGISKVKVTDCSFVGMGRHACLIYGGSDVEVSQNFVDRTGDPIVADSASLQFYTNTGVNTKGPRFTNNYVIGDTGTGAENALVCISWDTAEGGSCEGGVISGNTLLYGSMGISNARITNSVISGNHIEGAEYAGIEVAGSWGQTVSGNTINGRGTGHGIVVNPTGGCARLSIIGNTITAWGDTYDWGGIYVNELDGGTIANNTLTGTYTQAEPIYLLNVLNSTISGNVIRTNSTNLGIHLIAGTVNADNNIISGNVISVAGSVWSNGHIMLQAKTGHAIHRTIITGNNLSTGTGGGYGIELVGNDASSVVGTVVGQNVFSGYSAGGNLHETNTTGTTTFALASKPAVTGAKGANAALGSLLTALATLGLVSDSTT